MVFERSRTQSIVFWISEKTSHRFRSAVERSVGGRRVNATGYSNNTSRYVILCSLLSHARTAMIATIFIFLYSDAAAAVAATDFARPWWHVLYFSYRGRVYYIIHVVIILCRVYNGQHYVRKCARDVRYGRFPCTPTTCCGKKKCLSILLRYCLYTTRCRRRYNARWVRCAHMSVLRILSS